MSFIETPRFPETISAGSKFGPGYSTRMARNLGGYEAANKNWLYPLHRGDVITGCKEQADMNDLLAFFHGIAGMFNQFRFKNFNDYTAAGSQGTVSLISGDTYQMYKTRTFGALVTPWKVSKPVSGTVVVAGGGSYTVDYTTGIITRNSGAAPSGWTGEFDFPVRFDTDDLLPQWISFELYDGTPVPVIEVRL